MNALQAHQALQAATGRRAVPKATRSHVHVSPRPLVLAGYHLAGDPGAPLALMWGTSPGETPRYMVVPEPRNRALRFEALDEFTTEFLLYLAAFENRDDYGVCLDAPQLVVPNLATADWLGGIVGRFTRNLRADGDPPAPSSVPLAGKHLSFFADRLPGSNLILPATDALTMHWQTGQLPSEDLNLAALLGWIDPGAGIDGPEAARAGEQSPPAGPESDPTWDAETLDRLNKQWHAAEGEASRAEVREDLGHTICEQLTPAWRDCWRALESLDSLPVADHVATRWRADRESWTGHCDRMASGTAHFRNIPTPIQAARRLRLMEARTDDLEREMALDDPLVMAAAIASGEALAGRVAAVDPDRRTRNANGRRVRRPLITIAPDVEFGRPAGTTLFLAASPGVKLELLPSETSDLILAEVVGGANQNGTIGLLPHPGDDVILSPFGKSEFYQRPKVGEIPWTHRHVSEDQSEDSP